MDKVEKKDVECWSCYKIGITWWPKAMFWSCDECGRLQRNLSPPGENVDGFLIIKEKWSWRKN